MTIKKNQAILLSGVVFVLVILMGLRFITAEDEWICQNGKWTAHGKPIAPKPIVACSKNVKETEINETYCQQDADCACGTHKKSGACFYGNRNFVDTLGQCPDFCSGIDGKMVVGCENNICVQRRMDDGVEKVIK